MKAHITIFSEVGHTPITHRKGAYYDILLEKTIEVNSAWEAREKTKELIKTTKYGAKGFYYVPEEPNQNINMDWL